MVEGGQHHFKSAISKVEKGMAKPLTDQNAFGTFDTFSWIKGKERMGIIDRKIADKASQPLRSQAPLQGGGDLNQFAALSLRTIFTIDLMIAHDELKGGASHPRNLFSLGIHLHLFFDRFGTGRHHLSASRHVHLHKTEATPSEGKFHVLHRTEVGDVDS